MTTIRRRLTVWYTVALGVTMLIFGLLVYLEQRQSGIRDLDNRLALEAELAERWLTGSHRVLGKITMNKDVVDAADTVFKRKPLSLAPTVGAYFESLRDYTVVADSGGGVLALSDVARRLGAGAIQRLSALFDPRKPQERSGTIAIGLKDGPVRYLVRPIRNAGLDVGAVIVAIPIMQASYSAVALIRSMVVVAPLILASAFVVGYWLSQTSLQPLQSITDELEAITDGRSLHRRVAAPAAADELSRLVLTMNGMLARLEQSFASLRRFTADASHELKTPLMVLRAGVERALVHPGTPPESLQALDDTLAQINRMSEMVESLLTLARADEGRAPLAVEDTDLRDLVADVAETAGILGDEVGITVTVQFPDYPVRLPVDRHRVRDMLLNLVTNAVKYTPAGGSVGLTLVTDETTVTLTVRDTGIGIAPGDLPYIFERFWRADPARSRTGDRPGTGLGLAITKWIAEAHGGSITVASRRGRGTTFTVILPKMSDTPQDS